MFDKSVRENVGFVLYRIIPSLANDGRRRSNGSRLINGWREHGERHRSGRTSCGGVGLFELKFVQLLFQARHRIFQL